MIPITFIAGVIVGVSVSIGVYAIISAGDDDSAKGHPL